MQADAWCRLKDYHCFYNFSQYVNLSEKCKSASLSNIILVIKRNCCGYWQILQSTVSRPINQCCHFISFKHYASCRLLVHRSFIYLRHFLSLIVRFEMDPLDSSEIYPFLCCLTLSPSSQRLPLVLVSGEPPSLFGCCTLGIFSPPPSPFLLWLEKREVYVLSLLYVSNVLNSLRQ